MEAWQERKRGEAIKSVCFQNESKGFLYSREQTERDNDAMN